MSGSRGEAEADRDPDPDPDRDQDELLATLSCDELRQLEAELEDLRPDGRVPVGLRQKDQTAKSPTGSFDRDALLKYWEDENGKNLGQGGRQDKNGGHRGDTHNPGERRNTPQKCKRLQNLSRKSLEKAGESPKEVPREHPENGSDGNPVVIEEALEKVARDDPGTSEVNLNNIRDIPRQTLLGFAEALTSNTHVVAFSLANTHADDRVAAAISETLRQNRTIRKLNIESNFVSGVGVLALLEALTLNSTLAELRFHNQRHICGGKAEMEMVRLLRENTTLLKLGYRFDSPGPRMAATGILTRNQDLERQRRLLRKKEQSLVGAPPASEGHRDTVGAPASPSTSCVLQRKKEQSLAEASAQTSHKKATPKSNLHRKPVAAAPPGGETPGRKIAETVKNHEGSKDAFNQKKPKSKILKNGADERGSADILKELKKSLKPSLQRRGEESARPPPPSLRKSGRDDLMAAIRGSGVGSLKRVSHT